MTDSPHTPPRTVFLQRLRPFARDSQRWEKERCRALRTGHVCRDTACTGTCEAVPVYERTGWGWLAWTVPGNGTQPDQPVQIGVLTPGATMMQRLTVRWLIRPPAHRIPLAAGSPASLRLSAVIAAAISLLAALYALNRAVPADIVLTAMLLAPLLAEYLPDWLDTRAVEHVRWVEDDAACQYLQRLAGLHTYLVEAAAGSDRYELRRSAEIGHQLLWNAADLLQSENTRRVPARLIDQERLMVQLVDQVTQTLDRTRSTSSGQANHRSGARWARSHPASNQLHTQHPSRQRSLHHGRDTNP